MKKWNIEVSQEMYDLFERLFTSLGLKTPENISPVEMEEVLRRLELVIKASKVASFSQVGSSMKINSVSDPITKIARDLDTLKHKSVYKKVESYPKNAMVISKKGIIRYQLKSLLLKHDIETFVDENQYRGLAEYVKKLFEVVIIDNPGNISEIFDVIEEIRRISESNSVTTKIVILVEPENIIIKDKLITKGVDNVFVKDSDWYEVLLEGIKSVHNQLVVL